MNDDAGARPGLRRMWSPRMELAAIVAGAALLTAACSGGSGTTQGVASLGTSSGTGGGSSAGSGTGGGTGGGTPASGGSATAAPKGNPTQLLDEWAACMRSHGDPTQADPTIDASKVIHITTPPSVNIQPSGQNPDPPGAACLSYLNAASFALQAGYSPPKAPPEAALLKYSQCMRANGIPDFPDPVGDSLTMNRGAPGDQNPLSPAFQKAVSVCAQQTGVHISGSGGTPRPGTVDDDGGMFVPLANGAPGANG